MKPLRLFLADLRYIDSKNKPTNITIPLNVGFLAAYVSKKLPGEFEITIFKEPHKLLDALKEDRPDFLALSNYFWNENLSTQFARLAKKLHPRCITIMGGINYHLDAIEENVGFLREADGVDFHIFGEGESRFYELLRCCLEESLDISKVVAKLPAEVAFFSRGEDKLYYPTAIDGKKARIRDLDDIPSPYLTGLFDEFLVDTHYIPLIETNRGCPYSCTFCAWGGGGNQLPMFGLDRVKEELTYIANNNDSVTNSLYIADGNFGIFKRDVEVAELVRKLSNSNGFPKFLSLYFAKNSSKNVIEIASILKELISDVSLVFQTQNPDVLKNVKRSNIKDKTYIELSDYARSRGVQCYTDLIYGLPGESLKSFYQGVDFVAKQNDNRIHLFPTILLKGAEMSTTASREEFGLKGEFRIQGEGSYGTYGEIHSIEYEELILGNHAFSKEDFLEIRLFHFLQIPFVEYNIYRDVETFLGDEPIVKFVRYLIQNYKTAPEKFKNLMDEFIETARSELVGSTPKEFTSEDVSVAKNSRKLNIYFLAKLLYGPGVRSAFDQYLKESLMKFTKRSEREIDHVLEHIQNRIFEFDFRKTKICTLNFDVAKFAQYPERKSIPVSELVLDTPKTFKYQKKNVYEKQFGLIKDTDLVEKIYSFLACHRTEPYQKVFLYQFPEEIENKVPVTL